MSDTIFTFPGSFCPPTWGHFQLVEKAIAFLPNLTIICSRNPNKESNWFTEEECAALWRSYPLPPNVSVKTFVEFLGEDHDLNRIVMLRGIRDRADYKSEEDVVFMNFKNFGLDKILFVINENDISSTKARQAATELDLESLPKLVSPLVASALLEKALHLKNLFLVVGRPGSGKSTFLKMLHEIDPTIVIVNTDEYNKTLNPLLRDAFPNQDLLNLLLTREEDVKAVIQHSWFELLKEALRKAPEGTNVFVEIPYAFKPGMNLYKIFGGKTLYFDCGDKAENERRLRERGTSHLKPLIATIPDWLETKRLATKEGLRISCIDTSGSLSKMEKRVKMLADKLAHSNTPFPFLESDDDWRLTPERIAEVFRSTGFSYSNRRHLHRLGD